jgi:hypothetical protein
VSVRGEVVARGRQRWSRRICGRWHTAVGGIAVVSDGGLVSVAASLSNIELGFRAVEEVGEATVRSAESGGAARHRHGHRRRVGDGRGRREQSHWKRHMQSGGRRGDTRGVEIDKEEDSQKSRSPIMRWVGR